MWFASAQDSFIGQVEKQQHQHEMSKISAEYIHTMASNKFKEG